MCARIPLLAALLVGALPMWSGSASAQSLTTLYVFCAEGAPCVDGVDPSTGLIEATDGNLYGVTYEAGLYGTLAGTVFNLAPGGTLTTLADFCFESACPTGYAPGYSPTGIIQGNDGNFYGTATGTVFEMSPSGTLTALHTFKAGGFPTGLVQVANGNFFGTTTSTVFRMTPDGTVSLVHQLDLTEGALLESGVIQGFNGDLYGTASYGGNVQNSSGYGTVFQIAADGTFTRLHAFSGTDGAQPGSLVEALSGDLYGVTSTGGANGAGTLFMIGTDGKFSTLYDFCAKPSCTDGAQPQGLIQGSDLAFYGTTALFGAQSGLDHEAGTVFKYTPGGTVTTLVNFCGLGESCPSGGGSVPKGKLIQATNGEFYGVTSEGGGPQGTGGGTVFSLSAGLGPFLKLEPAYGPVGTQVRILGSPLTDASSVTFNGVAATYAVVSATEILATVPAGATRGAVQVVAPGGTLESGRPFIVKVE